MSNQKRAPLMFSLPEPSADAKIQSAALKTLISDQIALEGSISFSQFVELTQYTPGLGYYSAGAQKFAEDGKLQGDFVTAPELGSVFSQCIANLVAPVFLGHSDAIFLELGAGTGALACDVLATLDELQALPAEYWILERSADLRARQAAKLKARVPQLYHLVRWLDRPPECQWNGVLFGNEVVDALPFERFEITQTGAVQTRVGLNQAGEFCTRLGPAIELVPRICDLEELPLGYSSEYQPQLGAWLSEVTQMLTHGLVLLIDYGYTRSEYFLPERVQGTMVCHYQHRMFDDPFVYPGLVDISCSVDFTALAEAGLAANLELICYTSQSQLLRSAGLTDVLAAMDFENLPQRARSALSAEVRMLSLPGEMGERMQAMAWTRDLAESALHSAFSFPDWRHRL